MSRKKAPRNGIATRAATKAPDLPQAVQVAIDRHIPDDQAAVYANHFVVAGELSVFHLFCFQINPPVILGGAEAARKKALEIKSIQAECAAHIVIPAHQMPQLVAAMQETLEKNLAKVSNQIIFQEGVESKP